MSKTHKYPQRKAPKKSAPKPRLPEAAYKEEKNHYQILLIPNNAKKIKGNRLRGKMADQLD